MRFFTIIAAGVFAMVLSATRGLHRILRRFLEYLLINFTVSYDEGYDQGGRSMKVVSCSDGNNGLITKYGWQTQGDIPSFPYIGGSIGIAGWNSPSVCQCFL
jgi:hypothetical protein